MHEHPKSVGQWNSSNNPTQSKETRNEPLWPSTRIQLQKRLINIGIEHEIVLTKWIIDTKVVTWNRYACVSIPWFVVPYHLSSPCHVLCLHCCFPALSSAPPSPPTSSGSQAGWWCCVTWHLSWSRNKTHCHPASRGLQQQCRAGGGSQGRWRGGDVVIVIKPKTEMKLVSKKKEINNKKHTQGPSDTSCQLGTLHSFVCGCKVPS